jgi:hypothetical protein
VNRADFALQIINTPAVGARPGSADELAALGLDRHLRLAESTKYQGRSRFLRTRKTKKMLDQPGLLMEVKIVGTSCHFARSMLNNCNVSNAETPAPCT